MSGASFRTAAAGMVAILLVACGSTPSADTSAIDDPSPTASSVPAVALPDGETFAWVKGLTGDGFLVDPAEMLTGEEARRAAIEEGVIGEGEDLPNDFYIRDETDETAAVAASEDATYALMLFADGTPTETDVSFEEFTAALEGTNPDVYGIVEGVVPSLVTIEEGRITSIRQMYLP